MKYFNLDFQVRNMCYIKLKLDTKKINYLREEMVGELQHSGKEREARVKNAQPKRPDLCS